MRPEKFLETVRGAADRPASFLLGTIPAGYSSGQPTLQFDGESTVTTRTYPRLASYTPAAGDRVLVAMVGRGGVILGKVV